ncbi:MAG: transglycosylase domain-containing protein [Chloroflexota bacterium]
MSERPLSRLIRRPAVRIAALAAIVVGVALGVRAWLFVGLPDVEDLSVGLHTPSIRITDREGRLLYEVIGEEGGRHTVVPLDAVPTACQQATIATEDAHFTTNPGVDAWAILRAAWIDLRGGEVIAGGSTITQQVARNLLLDPTERSRRTLTRKLRESILAYRLTRRYGKDHILALYLNQTYYGNLAYGIDGAARAYFGKSASDLDLAECALLAGLPQAPSSYDPLTDPDAAHARQATVLRLMAENGFITAGQAEQAGREPLAFAGERYTIEAPHFVMAVIAQLEEEVGPEALLAGGLTVRTTLDLDWQHTAERLMRWQLDRLNTPPPGEPPHNAHNAALVALDPHTGQVLAMVGSPDYFDPAISGAVNLALAPRQPGSTMKPFTYALAFDPSRAAPWTAATMVLDVRTSFLTHEGFAYTPVNYDRLEHGPVLAREALASSYNVPAVIALDSVGVDSLLTFAGRLGITTFADPSEYDLSITLGGGEVRLLELTAAYAALANGGYAVHPITVLDVTDAEGEVLFAQESGLAARVIDPRVAWLISDILSDNLARAPGFTTHSILQIGRPAAVKTGTTTDFRDNWTVGYTPNLVTGVWVGNADGSAMVDVSGVSGAGPLWHHFMRVALRGQPELAFERPEGLAQVEVCSLSGLLPSPDCPYTRREWFIEGTEPTEVDTFYKQVAVDRLTGLPADDSTPPERVTEQVFLDLPPEAHDWARREGLALLPEPFAALAEAPLDRLTIASPDANTVFQIDPALPLSAQRLRLVAVGPGGLRGVTFYLDGAPLAMVGEPPFEVWWTLQVGEHRLYAVGTTPAAESTTSPTVTFRVDPPE